MKKQNRIDSGIIADTQPYFYVLKKNSSYFAYIIA